MRYPLLPEVEQRRVRSGPLASDSTYGNNGAFILTYTVEFAVIVSDGEGWEHVSVRPYYQDRTPTWEEMCYFKNLFWNDDECVVQYHPPKHAHINCHPNVLHLWKPAIGKIRMPPSWMVGPKGVGISE